MNTPAHAVVGLLAFGPGARRRYAGALLAGSLLPDAPMLVFYAVERIGRGTSESLLWSEVYWHPAWQNAIDLFNGLPLIALGAGAALALRRRAALYFFAAMALHSVCDLAVHHDDAHRHFFPLSDWRFASPVSYWDPNHFGLWAGAFELLLWAGGSAWLLRRSEPPAVRRAAAALLAVGVAYLAFAVVVWGPLATGLPTP